MSASALNTKTTIGNTIMLNSVRNAKPLAPITLRKTISRKLEKTVLSLDSLALNGGHIVIKQHGNTPYQFDRTNVIFTVSVPTKKFSFKHGKTHVTSAVVDFQLIATDCYWHEGKEAYVWDGDKVYKMHVDDELIHVVTQLRGKPQNVDDKGQYFIANGFEFFDDLGISGFLASSIANNSSKDDIRAVVDFALANCLTPESEW